ncbi:MAG: hypothetical protein NTU89_00020, partial [Candidatus Dependentiae bacterium]|nr:hypothetical protein [Candidatus Dependentiae bacterium]
NYLFLLSAFMSQAPTLSAMHEAPTEDIFADMKERFNDQDNDLLARQQAERDRYNRIKTNFDQDNNYNGIADDVNKFRTEVLGRDAQKTVNGTINLPINLEHLSNRHNDQWNELRAKQRVEWENKKSLITLDKASFVDEKDKLPTVKKSLTQRASDWINDYFYSNGPVANAKNVLTREGLNATTILLALKDLSATQRLDVISSYLHNPENKYHVEKSELIIKALNKMLPKNEKVSVGKDGISIMKAQS